MYFLSVYDFILVPLYLLLAVIILNAYFKKRHGYNPGLKKHFTRGLLLKLFGCVAIALIYEFYYYGAFDGRFYFDGAKMLSRYWSEYPSQILTVLFNDVKHFNSTNLMGLLASDVAIFADASFFVSKVAAFFNLFSFNAFIPCSIFFCIIAFLAIWNFFILIVTEFKLNFKIAGLCSLYIPSVLIWDSSIFKDTITFTALLWMFICGFYLFIKPKRIIANALGFLVAAIFISQVKAYILAAFIPFFILYVFNSFKNRIANPTLKRLSTPILLAAGIGSIVLFLLNADELLGKYAIDEVLESASRTSADIGALNAGSAYSMNVDLSSPGGLLLAVPAGINATLFRPYPWEYLKVFILFASVESMFFLYFTIRFIRSLGFKNAIRLIRQKPVLQFTLFFTLLFAFMVGVSSSNFGSLVRYKIPILPFYALFLAVLYSYSPLNKSKKVAVKKVKKDHALVNS